jgi:hypothetical protein
MSSSHGIYHHLLPLTRAVWRLSLFCPFMIDRHASLRYHAPSSRPGRACSTYLKSESCDIRRLQDRRPIQSIRPSPVITKEWPMRQSNSKIKLTTCGPPTRVCQDHKLPLFGDYTPQPEDRKIGAIGFFDQVVCAISRHLAYANSES